MHKKVHNLKAMEENRKALRNNSTPAEIKLWMHLKDKQLEGRKFRRQHSVGSYILDFYCPSERLAIELDGHEHFTASGIINDEIRTDNITSMYIKIIRFENKQVLEHTQLVLEEIKSHFKKSIPS